MSRAIDCATPVAAAAAGAWCTARYADIVCIAGRRAPELSGLVYEVALVAHRRHALDQLTPKRAIKLAIARELESCPVRRPRGERRPRAIGGDSLARIAIASTDPAELLMQLEDVIDHEDFDCDHDDRLSWTAQRAAGGHQPIDVPLSASLHRQRRRWRARRRNLVDAGQQDLWPGGGAA